MSKSYDNVIPTVISDEVLLAAVEEQQERDGVIEVAQEEDVDFSKVKELKLDFKNILKIEHLWCFDSLVKLQLDNNVIEKIEGLDMLVHLIWLDLSFNNIERIEGLNELRKLQDLSLYNNRIQRIESMDSLVHLHVLSIGNNDISELENILYLRRFKELRTLNMAGNPVCSLEDYKPYTLAHLPNIQYIDYRRVNKQAREEACNRYEMALQELQAEENVEESRQHLRLSAEQDTKLYKECFVERLKGSTLFESMYLEDIEGQRLALIPGVQDMVDEYRETFVGVCESLFAVGLERQKQRREEVDDFQRSIERAKQDSEKLAAMRIDEFNEYKNKVYQELSEVLDPSSIDIAVTEYHQRVGDLWDSLMNLEMTLADQLEEAVGFFERSVAELVDGFLESVRAHLAQLRDLENKHNESMQEKGVNALDMANRNELNEDVMEQLQDMLVDKDSVLSAVAASHDCHILKIDGCEDEIISEVQNWQTKLIENVTEQEVVQRNRRRVVEISHIIDHLRDEIDNIDFTTSA